jgi:CTP synthase (UTP-ammonia lyase)
VSARGAQGEIRAIESPAHRFFVATLFQPQLSSEPSKPHPIIIEFLRASAKWKGQKLEDSVLE